MIIDNTGCINQVDALKAWYDTELGQQFLSEERQLIERALLNVQGSRLLQVTLDGRQWLCDTARAQHGVLVAPRIELGMEERTLIAEPEALPVQSAVIDLLVLHHAYEFSTDPHQVLREAARVLRPGGYLLVLGFNPSSWLGLHARFKRKQGSPWRGNLLSLHRLNDWLKLLQLGALQVHSSYYAYPLKNRRWRQRFSFMSVLTKTAPFKAGNLFLLTARKDVAGLTPLFPLWNRRLLGSLHVIESNATSSGIRRSSK